MKSIRLFLDHNADQMSAVAQYTHLCYDARMSNRHIWLPPGNVNSFINVIYISGWEPDVMNRLHRAFGSTELLALQAAEAPDINIICEKVAFDGVTRFEDKFRLPLGVTVNLTDYSAQLATEVSHAYLPHCTNCSHCPRNDQSRVVLDSVLLCLDASLSCPSTCALEGSCCCDQLFFHGFSSVVSMTDLVETMEEKLVTAKAACQGTGGVCHSWPKCAQ